MCPIPAKANFHIVPEVIPHPPKVDKVAAILTKWNSLAAKHGFPAVRKNNQQVHNRIAAVLKEHPEKEYWTALFQALDRQPYLKAESWFSFPWVLAKPDDRVEKVLREWLSWKHAPAVKHLAANAQPITEASRRRTLCISAKDLTDPTVEQAARMLTPNTFNVVQQIRIQNKKQPMPAEWENTDNAK